MRSPPVLHLLALALRRDLSTIAWPGEVLTAEGPDRGYPVFDPATCSVCGDCVGACPSGSLALEEGWTAPVVDAGVCVRCGTCTVICGEDAVSLTGNGGLAAYTRQDLVMDGTPPAEVAMGPPPSRLFRDSVDGRSRVGVEPFSLLKRRSSELLSGKDRSEE